MSPRTGAAILAARMQFGQQTDEGLARIRAIVQTISDLVRPGALDGLRVLDLGAGDGAIAIELALRGASVVAVEGREQNAETIRAHVAADAIDPDHLRVEVADVRHLNWVALGAFDVTICSGLLYHLELQDVIDLTRAIAAGTTRLALFDTEVAWGPLEERNGYSGHLFREHDAETSATARAASRLASLDNELSFWLTRPSLHALLHDAGFASSYELGAPGQPRRAQRATVAALAGDRIGRLALEPERPLPPARPGEPQLGRLERARVAVARRMSRRT